MMKNFKYFAVPACLLAALFLASTCFGQVDVAGVGSSAQFNIAGVSAFSGGYCGANIWTNNGLAVGVDARGGTIPHEPGKIWVTWDNSTTPTEICYFLSVDSVVGQRLFYGTGTGGNGTLSIPCTGMGGAETTPGSGQISYIQDTATAGLPAAVCTAINGSHFNAAFTDIRGEDGQYANTRASCATSPSDTFKECMGYGGAGGIGTAVQSSYSAATLGPPVIENSAQVILYSISTPSATGTDPISSLTVPESHTVSIGADPVLVFVNTLDTTSGGFGNINPSNVQSHVLSAIYAGFLGYTTDITGTTGGKAMNVVEREPTSGTYNTFEWQTVRNSGTDLSQEMGNAAPPTGQNCYTASQTSSTSGYYAPSNSLATGQYSTVPAPTCNNPLNLPGPNGSYRTRAIGTGEMIAAVNSPNNLNGLGYAFWSAASFAASKAGNTKYLAVDGVDPLFANYTTGSYPVCSGKLNSSPAFSCTTPPTFTNITNGAYRIWSVLRVIVTQAYWQSQQTTPTNPSVTGLVSQIQSETSTLPDLVSAASLPVFRSHYTLSGATGINGTYDPTDYPESGGDMAGAIFNVQADKDYVAFAGAEFTGYIQ